MGAKLRRCKMITYKIGQKEISNETYQQIVHDFRFNNMYIRDIAKKYNVYDRALSKFIRQKNIIRAYKDEKWLHDQFEVKALSTSEIATIAHCGISIVNENCNKWNLKQDPTKVKTKKVAYDTTFFETIDTESKAYWLGFSMIDGGLSYTTGEYRLRFQLQRRDKSHLLQLANTIAIGATIQDGSSKRTETSEQFFSILKIYNKKICTDLMKLGMRPSQKNRNKFPDIPEILYPHFIRGVFDADGSLHVDQRGIIRLTLASSAHSIITYIHETLEDIIHDNTLSTHKERNMTFINATGVKAYQILHWIYTDSTIHLDRKKEIYSEWLITKTATQFLKRHKHLLKDIV